MILINPFLPEGEGGKDNSVTFIEIRGVQVSTYRPVKLGCNVC
jgi:hypothetical protein